LLPTYRRRQCAKGNSHASLLAALVRLSPARRNSLDPDLFDGAKELIAEHRSARRCRQPFRLRVVVLDGELGPIDAPSALLALDVEALLADARAWTTTVGSGAVARPAAHADNPALDSSEEDQP
jgi:hypothetical protein